MNGEIQNPNPVIKETRSREDWERRHGAPPLIDGREAIDAWEVFEHIRHVADPEHPLTLEQLDVVAPERITVDDAGCRIVVQFTPTIPHCSMATLIGLCIRMKLSECVPSRFKVDVLVSPGSHASELDVNRQLNDKERVLAAVENESLSQVVSTCIRAKY
jgi:metal-sulfur cluster biosynthetic enzyme